MSTVDGDLSRDVRAVVPSEGFELGHARVGIDLEDIGDCEQLFESGLALDMLRRSFTAIEREYIGKDPALFAGRWAAKEAVSKAIGTGFRGLNPGDIEVYRAENGQPFVRPAPGAAWPGDTATWFWSISISRAGNGAIAIALGSPKQP